jgi:hypothetical protein
MDIKHEVVACKTCNRPRQFLEYELINLVIHQEGDEIGNCKTRPAALLRFYCQNCQTNTSEPHLYQDPAVIPNFIKDVKSHSAKFEAQEYISI